MKTSTLLKVALVAGSSPRIRRVELSSRPNRYCTSLLTLLALLFGHLAVGQVFYIAPDGDDDPQNSGQDQGAPWQSIDRVNLELLSGGNKTFLFKRGEEYRGAINIPFGVNNISFGAYGTGARPVIKNSKVVTSAWSPPNGNIYKASVAIPTNSKMVRLYNDGDLRTYARHPNSG